MINKYGIYYGPVHCISHSFQYYLAMHRGPTLHVELQTIFFLVCAIQNLARVLSSFRHIIQHLVCAIQTIMDFKRPVSIPSSSLFLFSINHICRQPSVR